jgi:RNA polymerase sigma-70 factor (ECF subfamily)
MKKNIHFTDIVTSDDKLIESYLLGNEYGFELLIEKHKNFVFQFINSKIKNSDISNDLFQETFIKVILALKSNKYNENGNFLPWVIRIANNLVMDHYRHIERKPMFYKNQDCSLLYNYPEQPSTMEHIMVMEYNFSKVKILMEKLLPEQRELLILRFEEEKSFKEIANITGVNINTALGRFRYAIVNLRKIIKTSNIQLLN